MIKISKGLDLPIEGAPSQKIDSGQTPRRVALVSNDYLGLKPRLLVGVGDQVKLGQAVFQDKKVEGVQFTSPGSGRVIELNRGEKRHFQSLVIELEGEEQVEFASYADRGLTQLSQEEVRTNLIDSGLWTAFRTRPFSAVPAPEAVPNSIFVSAMDTNPLAPDASVIIAEREGDFQRGLQVISVLTEGKTFVCVGEKSDVPDPKTNRVQIERFSGPHPAGLAGTHIHFLDPVSLGKTVWSIGYQDVIAIGQLFVSGRLAVDRVIALAGPAAREPRLIRTRLGACIPELVVDELKSESVRLISGSVLSGREATGPQQYLGRFHQQISVLQEGRPRVLFEWMLPGSRRFSVKNVYASATRRGEQKFTFTTSQEGSPRSMVPVGAYEKVVPLDVLPTYLLRSLIIGDLEQATALGCLELDEEDLALCSFVCPGKYDYGPMLRNCLSQIEKEG
ncbi:MAG: Na(+)-translocating NADH-quinone reductase subunit A [Planctomycetaceae bacterium]|nr:Na(+)-translocating NADH-quinone reductase subunit A [Planctomycetaceae bacterium]